MFSGNKCYYFWKRAGAAWVTESPGIQQYRSQTKPFCDSMQFCAAKYWLRISMSTDGSLLLVEKLESIQTQIYVVGPWSLCRQCSVNWQHQIHQAVDFVSFQWHRMGSSVINKLKLTKENNSGWRMKNTQDPWPHNKSHGAHEHAAGNQKLFWKWLN